MANKSLMKIKVTKLKNKIINWLHTATVQQLVETAKFVNIRVSQDLIKKVKEKDN